MLPASPCQLRIWPCSIAGWPWHTCMCIKSQGIIDPCNCSRETSVHSNPRYILVWQGQNAVHFARSNPWMRATCGPSSVLEASSDAALNTGHHTLQSNLATVCEKASAIHVVSVTCRAANGYTRQISSTPINCTVVEFVSGNSCATALQARLLVAQCHCQLPCSKPCALPPPVQAAFCIMSGCYYRCLCTCLLVRM
jgi:hypothetical protein